MYIYKYVYMYICKHINMYYCNYVDMYMCIYEHKTVWKYTYVLIESVLQYYITYTLNTKYIPKISQK